MGAFAPVVSGPPRDVRAGPVPMAVRQPPRPLPADEAVAVRASQRGRGATLAGYGRLRAPGLLVDSDRGPE